MLLKPRDKTDEVEKGLVGNTILVAQPAPQLVATALPPSEAEQVSYFNVVYSTGRDDLRKKVALTVNRAHYLDCARVRAARCPLFAEITIDESKAQASLPVDGIPAGVMHGALEMQSIEHFAPNLSGPASRQAPFCNTDTASAEEQHEEMEEEDVEKENQEQNQVERSGCFRAPDALIAEENNNAEFLIGLEEAPEDCAVAKLAAFRAKLRVLQEHGRRLTAAARRQAETTQAPDIQMELATDTTAAASDHRSACVDLRLLAKRMGTSFQEQIEAEVAATARSAPSPATLRITTGAPLSFFDAATWVACFVEFFYGDCVPNLARPAKISWRRLFRYLMNREELEYHLATDNKDPSIPGGRYTAPSQSRWNTPEFAAVFVDTVRKIKVLQSTQGFFTKHSKTFAQDMRFIAKATDKDFEVFQANLRKDALQGGNIPALISAAKQQAMPGVQKVLQHMLLHTSNVAMTQGNKMILRHMGQSMNVRFGPFSSFFTSNFADTYNPFTVVLNQGAGKPLGPRALNILQDSPTMPTSQEMHKMVALHPMTQANLFLLLDALTHQHLLCVRNAFLGYRRYDQGFRWQREPLTEDDFSSTGDPGIAGLVRGVIKALEAQGRGFTHGHEKVHSEPQTKAIDLWHLISHRCVVTDGDGTQGGAPEHSDSAGSVLDRWMKAHREECLLDATTKQYDSSVECGQQFGIAGLKEAFTVKERQRCRLDGGCEEDGRHRESVEVVPDVEPAHLWREREAATAEARPLRHAYRELPLTGAPGARHPCYLLPRNYQCFSALDDAGHAPETIQLGASEHETSCETAWVDPEDVYILNTDGEVCGFRKPDGTMATSADHQTDAALYARNFALDARMCHIFNHTHDCKATCFKYNQTTPTKQAEKDTDTTARQRQSCRFRFWRVVEVGGKFFRRLGKALVTTPYVAHTDDDNNEYGRCIVRRHNCFRGSSNDVCQVVLRCNVDLQYQVRTFPQQQQQQHQQQQPQQGAAEHSRQQEEGASEHATVLKKDSTLPCLLRCLSNKVTEARVLLISAAIAMRSSHISDFYATKYLAKPQQWLQSVLGPLTHGLRTMQERQTAVGEKKPTTHQEALRKVRTAIFAANRSIWISCCEAAVFLLTGGAAVQSHADVPVHARRGLFMMHECKRMLNNEIAGTGLWEARLPEEDNEQRGQVFQVTAPEQDADSDSSTEQTDLEQQEEHIVTVSGAAEHIAEDGDADHNEEDDDCAKVRCLTDHKHAGVQVFQITTSLRDDWLHRGPALYDMDLNTYASHVERTEKPMLHAATTSQPHGKSGLVVPFDAHYKLAGHYAQRVKRRSTAITRYVGPNCERETVNEGEENAAYKAFHCSLLRCPGPEQCANPSMCRDVLFQDASGKWCFRAHWRARQAEILVLAVRGYEKKLRARRVEVLADTSLYKRQSGEGLDSATEHVTNPRMCQIDVLRMFRQKVKRRSDAQQSCPRVCLERAIDLILQFTGVPSLWHPDQLHVSEWQALQELEFIFNVTLSVDGKNMALAKFAKHKGHLRMDAEVAMEPSGMSGVNMYDVEEHGGVGNDDEVADEDIPTTGLLAPTFSQEEVLAFLDRDAEVQLAKQPGQGRREGIQNMRQVDGGRPQLHYQGLMKYDTEAK